MNEETHSNIIAGWREWASLPDAGVRWIKAKLDTGAKTSSLHAFNVEPFTREGVEWVAYSIHPWQRSDEDSVRVESPILDRRLVRSSSGHEDERIAVPMRLRVVRHTIDIELTLSNRDEMGFRMLIGREALMQGYLVDSSRSYLGPRPKRSTRDKNWGRERPTLRGGDGAA